MRVRIDIDSEAVARAARGGSEQEREASCVTANAATYSRSLFEATRAPDRPLAACPPSTAHCIDGRSFDTPHEPARCR